MVVTLTVLRGASKGWQRHHTGHLAAALSFYLAFSLAPLLVIAIAIAGFIIGRQSATVDVLGPLNSFVGASGARFLSRLVQGLSQPQHNAVAAAIGVAALIVGAAGAFTQLQDALNIIFESSRKALTVWRLFRVRFFAFGMVLTIGLLMLALQILNVMLVSRVPHSPIAGVVTVVVAAIVIAASFAALFRLVPESHVEWRNALIGGCFTAVLFLLGQWGMSVYVRYGALSTLHGAAAAGLIVMTSLYYSSAVLLFGAEFTAASARRPQESAQPPHYR